MSASKNICELCGAEIPDARKEAVSDVRTCVSCQRRVERGEFAGRRLEQVEAFGAADREASAPIRVDEGLVRFGSWTANPIEVVGKTIEIQGLIRSGRKDRARSLVQALPVEAQAALVALDEDPERMLSLTAMDAKGRPGYSTAVVARLPSETIASLISVNAEEKEWNGALMKAMTPSTLRRAVEETLDPIDDQSTRGKVSWEWLQAVASVHDANKVADLLRGCTVEVLEDALIHKMDPEDLNRVVGGLYGQPVPVFRFFSEEGAGGIRPSAFIRGEVGRVLDDLYEAAPDLIAEVIRRAWERTVDEDDEVKPKEGAEKPEARKGRSRKRNAEEEILEAAAEALIASGEPMEAEETDEDRGDELSLWGRNE